MKQLGTLTTESPAAIDILWCQHLEVRNAATHRIDGWRKRLTAEDGGRFRSGYEYPVGRTMTDYYAAVEKAEAAISQADEAIAPLQAEYDRRGGWTRYLAVPNGHYHHFRGCSSLRWTTYTVWTPKHSGKTADEIVALLGEGACTKCFPDAPVMDRGSRVKDGQCPGSVFHVPGDQMMVEKTFTRRSRTTGEWIKKTKKVWRSRYACPSCGKTVSVGQTHKLRAHKAK